MTLFERAVRPALFRIGGGDAENAHEWTLRRLERLPAPVRRALHARYAVRAPRTVFGIDFPNPVGLAAGMDKDGRALGAWPALGFGFVEVGTVTPAGQPGNERPRLFRLRAHDALVNRMGFNNAGAAALAARMRPVGVPVGVSLGKAKATALDQAVGDYVEAYKLLRDHGDYFAVNVSSPNTPGLCTLQDRGHLDELLSALVGDKPVLVKIAPDLTDAAVADALAVCLDRGAAGVIATNTTLGRAGLPEDVPAGGLSGRPLTARARAVVDFVHRETGGKLPIVGVGGIMTGDDGARMFDAGADLVQLYTGFIYHGPALVRAVAKAAR